MQSESVLYAAAKKPDSTTGCTETDVSAVVLCVFQLQHQELMAQLRENNLPEFVERLLSDKNQQIEELEQNVRSLSHHSMVRTGRWWQSSARV